MLLHDFRARRPDVSVKLTEDKTIRLLPRLVSGRLDLALVRPPERPDERLEFLFLLHETAVVAVSDRHPLASKKRATVHIASRPSRMLDTKNMWTHMKRPSARPLRLCSKSRRAGQRLLRPGRPENDVERARAFIGPHLG